MKRDMNVQAEQTADFTLTVADSGKLYPIGAVDLVATLPAVTASNKNCWFSFSVNDVSATTGFSVSPNAADGIAGGAVNKDFINTAATDVIGDCLTVVSSGTAGTAGWVVANKGGIWAAEG